MYGFFYAQSEYSILDNAIKLEDLVNKSANYGYKFVALADNNMHGAYKFFSLCKNVSIKPIIGLKVKLVEGSILLYAYNNIGYSNLCKISSFSYNKKINLEDLKDILDGLFAVTTGYDSIIEKLILAEKLNEASKQIDLYRSFFKLLFIGIQNQDDFSNKYNSQMLKLANEKNIKILPIHKTCYLNKEDVDAYEIIKQIKGESNVSGDYYLKSIEELVNEFPEYEVFINVEDVYNMVDVSINKIEDPLIKYENKNNISSKEYLSELCFLGLKKRLNGRNANEYVKRLNNELEVISKMGFDDYFLIVYDYIRYAKKQGILVGEGRGSVCGSLVAYSLGITEIDPIKYNLFFERFLNIERVSMPDIDVDIPDDKRDIVINYLIDKYGTNHACTISTFNTFQKSQAFRDVAKLKGVENYKIDEISKFLAHNSLDDAIETFEETEVLTLAKKIVDLPKSISVHPAGIILSKQNISDMCATLDGVNGIQSQFEAADLEELGMLKMDLLSLKTLSLLDKLVKVTGVKLNEIPLDDKKTFDLLSSGLTLDIFQLDTPSFRRVLKKFKPENIEHLIALLALNRPGPKDQIDEYIARKNGKEFEYVDNSLEPILKSTYGIIVYQEQIMQIASSVANYSLGEADILRRLISKKHPEELESERIKFVKGCKNKEVGEKLFDYIVKFGDYGFNRNHSVAYALLAYKMAYIKANYTLEFVQTALNDAISDTRKMISYFEYLRLLGYNIVNPNINYSEVCYILKDNSLIMPFNLIKGITKEEINQIIEERKNGLFKSFSDFKERVNFKRDVYEALIKASCFDELIGNLLNDLEKSEYNINTKDEEVNEDIILPYETLVEYEYEVFGFNVKYSITDKYFEEFKKFKCTCINELIDGEYNIIAYVKNISEILTKKKESMAFVKVCDGRSSIELLVFPKNYNLVIDSLNSGSKIAYAKDVFLMRVKSVNRAEGNSFELVKARKL